MKFKLFQDCMKITCLISVTLVFILQSKKKQINNDTKTKNKQQQEQKAIQTTSEREYILDLRIESGRNALPCIKNCAQKTTGITEGVRNEAYFQKIGDHTCLLMVRTFVRCCGNHCLWVEHFGVGVFSLAFFKINFNFN